ncbi:hypothetical protein EV2_024125 [Malus domestica]
MQEVESIVVPLLEASSLNKDGLTPPELFTEKHKELLKDGEKWMKDTSTSYTVVNALLLQSCLLQHSQFLMETSKNRVSHILKQKATYDFYSFGFYFAFFFRNFSIDVFEHPFIALC